MKPFGTSMTTKLTMRAAIALVVASAGAAWCLPPPFADISSAGPLTHVWVANDLSCQVQHIADAPDNEFYGPDIIPGDSGTFITVGGALYAPDFINHDYTSAGFLLGDYTPFTPVSQTPVIGSGTAADPFKVITVVDVAATRLRIQQTDTYVTGREYYTTEVMISNNGSRRQAVSSIGRRTHSWAGPIPATVSQKSYRQPQGGGLLCECKQLANW